MLDASRVDDVFEYVRSQTNKIDPVLDKVDRPSFVDQLVESYIADLVLYLMEILGPKRAEIFKRTHLQMQAQTPTSKTMYLTPGKKHFLQDQDMVETGGVMDHRYNTVYGNKMTSSKKPKRVGMKT